MTLYRVRSVLNERVRRFISVVTGLGRHGHAGLLRPRQDLQLGEEPGLRRALRESEIPDRPRGARRPHVIPGRPEPAFIINDILTLVESFARGELSAD